MSPLLCLIFFASGASALVFETLWFHQAGLALGNGVWASSLVLAGFMGGLALGNAFAARSGARLGNPLRAYALAEIAIAVSGAGLVWLLPSVGSWIAPWLAPLADLPWILNPLRLSVAFALLLVPSTAMGVTLPLLTSALTPVDANYGRVLGRLYGWNTFGAVAGALATETLLIEALGVRGSALAAGTANAGAAAVALLLAGRRTRTRASESAAAPVTRRAPARFLLAAFGAGFALLALEVVWFRFLSLFVLSRSIAFALMLGVVLTGIAVGGLAASHWLGRDPRAHRFAAPLAFCAGALCIAGYACFPIPLAHFLETHSGNAWGILSLAAPLMFPVALASGILFGLLGAALRCEFAGELETTGTLTFANTVGAALGSLAGGFVLLPALGIEFGLLCLALLYGAIGTLLANRAPAARRHALLGALALVVALAMFPFGAMRERYLPTPMIRFGGPDDRIAAVREGLTETIIYVENRELGHRVSHRMMTNAYSMSGTMWFARRYMKLYVYWPVAVHPELRSALLISYGVGATGKALTDTRALESIDIVDISRDVLEMNSIVFPDPKDQPLRDPRVRVHVEDGRYFLQTTDRRFDLITGEPPPPNMAGVVNLYTREYFELVRERLAEGGITTYWLPIHALSDRATLSVLRAFCDAFDDCSLWHGSSADLMMVGTRGATGAVAPSHFAAQWRDPVVAPELAALGFERPEQLGALFIGDADWLRALTRDAPALTDDRPKRITAPPSSAEAPAALLARFTDTEAARKRFLASAFTARLWPDSWRAASAPWFDFQRLVNELLLDEPNPETSRVAELHRVLRDSTLRTPVLWLLGSDADRQHLLDVLPPTEQTRPELQLELAIRRIADRDFEGALAPLENAEHLPEKRRTASGLRILALAMAGRLEAATELADARYHELGEDGRMASFWQWLAAEYGIDPRGLPLASGVH
jgi:spermidine synthase